MFLILFLLAQVAAKSVKTWGCEGDAECKDLPPPPTPRAHMYGGESAENRHWYTSGINSQRSINFKELSHFLSFDALAPLTFKQERFFRRCFLLCFKFELIFIAIT